MSVISRNLLIGCGVAALLVAAIYFVWGNGTTLPTLGLGGATTTVNGVSGTGSYTVEPVGAEPPSLDRPIVITAELSAEAKTVLTRLLTEQIDILGKEPTRVDVWLKYGINRKIAGDYEAAIEAWEYVAQVAPKEVSATAHGNLGDLYMYFLKDYAKAEVRYQQAITLNPNIIEYYRSLFYLYKDVYKDNTKAQATLTAGLKANPNHPDLLRYQTELKTQS